MRLRTYAVHWVVVHIHDRRPVVMAPDLVREWPAPAKSKERAEAFDWFKAGTAVGNVKNHGPELSEPLAMPS